MPIEPGGCVSDYVQFYFAPRSPMLFAIHGGNVPTCTLGTGRLIYLTTTTERLRTAGLRILSTDRNAVLRHAGFTSNDSDMTESVDWELMAATYWSDTEEDPTRRERRMAECLVHQRVPWAAFSHVAAHNESSCAKRWN